MSSDPNKQGQYPPPQWESQPQRGAYPAPPNPAVNYRVSTSVPSQDLLRPRLEPYTDDPFQPPPQGYGSSPSTPGEMINLPPPQHQQHPHPEMYGMRQHDMYAPYPPDPRGIPPPHMGYQSQPAPRQRTAIACRYCRRRKVRFTTHTFSGRDTY